MNKKQLLSKIKEQTSALADRLVEVTQEFKLKQQERQNIIERIANADRMYSYIEQLEAK